MHEKMDCLGTYFTHAETCDKVRVPHATGRIALDSTFGVTTPVTMFVFKMLRNGLLRYIFLTHARTCDNVRVPSATEWDLNRNLITGLAMRKVFTAAVHSVALGKRMLSQAWACKKYVPKQSIP